MASENVNDVNTPAQRLPLHKMWLEAGFLDTIPVMPPNAVLHETSKVSPDARGKCPGDYFQGAWDGMGSWPTYHMNAVKAARWDELGANVGLKMGGRWTMLDVDITDDVTAQTMMNRIHEIGSGSYFIRWGQWPKFAVLFQIAPGETIRRRQFPLKRDGVTQRIEILGVTAKGRPSQAVVAGVHPSGQRYQWNAPIAPDAVLPATAAQMDLLVGELMTVAESRGWTKGRASNVNKSNDGLSRLGSTPQDIRLVGPIVDLIANNDLEYDDWCALAYAIKNACGGGGWEIFERFSAKAPKNDPAYTKRTWDSMDAEGLSGFGKLVYWARRDVGGTLPGDLEKRVKQGMTLKRAMAAGMPETAPQVPGVPAQAVTGEIVPDHQPVTIAGANGVEFAYKADGTTMVQNAANIEAYLVNSDLWAGALAFDVFQQRPVFLRDVPMLGVRQGDAMEDRHGLMIYSWFQRHVFAKISKQDVNDGISLAAERARFDPLVDYLDGLTWDGVPRINSWLWTYCGVKDMDPLNLHYLSTVGRKWLIAAVARGLSPGEKADNALIFEGPQGVGKSSALAALCPNKDWFGDGLPDFTDKDAKVYLLGKWIIEMAELTQLKKSELTHVRQFIGQQVDDFRLPFGRLNVRVPRRMIFAGSTNNDDYLKDPAGERRMWIVQVDGKFDIPGLTAVRDQLWAEAVHAFKSDEKWHLQAAEESAARHIQMDRVQVDPWQDTLASLLVNRPETSLPECFALLGIDDKSRTTQQMNRLKTALIALGYVRQGRIKARGAYRHAAKYVRP